MSKSTIFQSEIGSDIFLDLYSGPLDSALLGRTDMSSGNLEVFLISNQELMGFSDHIGVDPNSIELLDYLRGIYFGDFWYTFVLFRAIESLEIDPKFMPILDMRHQLVSKKFVSTALSVIDSARFHISTAPKSNIIQNIGPQQVSGVNKSLPKKVLKKLEYNADFAYICIILLKILKEILDEGSGNIESWLLKNKDFQINLYAGLLEAETIEYIYNTDREYIVSKVEGGDVRPKVDKFLLDRILKQIRNART